jgi:hypothetical protein
MGIRTMAVPGVERVISKHVKRFHGEIVLHDLIDIAVVPEGQLELVQAAVRLIDAVLCLKERVVIVLVGLEVLRACSRSSE